MNNSNKPNSSTEEILSSCFDGDGELPDLSKLNESHRNRWKTYALISDVMGKKQSEEVHISNFAEKMKKVIANEPACSQNILSTLIKFIKTKYNKIPVMVAGPAFALGLVFVLVEPTADKINVVVESEIPEIMDSYCQLHENGTGGAALC